MDPLGYISTKSIVSWNYRLMKFDLTDTIYPNAFEVLLVEVYYENGEPHSWCDPHPLRVDDLDCKNGYDPELISLEYSRLLLQQQAKFAEALSKPILLASDFEPLEKNS